MNISVYNGSLDKPHEHGSFTVLAAQIRSSLIKKGIYTEDQNNYPVLVPECLDTRRRFPIHIPVLASEYSLPPQFTVNWVSEYATPIMAISEFSRQNLIRGGISPERIFTNHLGSNPDIWYPVDVAKFPIFTFLTVNSSNDRSAFEIFIPEFIKFAKENPVRLIIKDGKNERFKEWLTSLNCDKIIYIDESFTEQQMRELYSSAHCHVYYNHTTSFNMTNLDAALCGIPTLITLGSAPQEFTPEWTQTPYLVKTELKPLDSAILDEWNAIGLRTPTPTMYPPGTMREAIIPDNICNSLQYMFDNYLEMVKKNQEFQRIILKTLTWDRFVERAVDVLSKFS